MNKRELIKQAKAERKLSTDDLAGASGVPRTTLYRYFKGADMRGTAVEAVERALGIAPYPDPAPIQPQDAA
jgi:AcrR family transcriptional regulator